MIATMHRHREPISGLYGIPYFDVTGARYAADAKQRDVLVRGTYYSRNNYCEPAPKLSLKQK